jgi:hypothetical protein
MIRLRIVIALTSQGAALCQDFTWFEVFNCAFLEGEARGQVWAHAIGSNVT